jgi:hypothetical protein
MLLGDWDGYCAKMTKDSTWGGNLELAAVARRYKTHITIHQLGAPRLEVMCHGQSGCPTIHLSYHMGEHYSSVRSEKESAAFVGTSIDLDARLRKAGVKIRSPDEPREEPQSKNEKIVMVFKRHNPYHVVHHHRTRDYSNDMLNAWHRIQLNVRMWHIFVNCYVRQVMMLMLLLRLLLASRYKLKRRVKSTKLTLTLMITNHHHHEQQRQHRRHQF